MLRRLAATLVLAAVGVSALASITGYLLVRTGLDPIRHLARQAGSLGADTLHRRLSSARQPQELLPLVEQFNALLSRLGDAYTQLEAFNSDVAHELKTPLATLISGCELALRRPRNSAELEEQIASNLEDLHRLSAIVQDMLFLSHADQGSRARRLPVQSFAALAASVVEYHDAAIQAAGLNVEVHGDASGAFDAALLQRALSNLLMNATRYGSPGSTIRILIAATAGSRELSFSVKNEGPGIDPVDLPKVFDRFFRGDKSRSAGQQQHGLGLAIVAAIARMHDGRAFATSSGGTTEVGMRLPIPA